MGKRGKNLNTPIQRVFEKKKKEGPHKKPNKEKRDKRGFPLISGRKTGHGQTRKVSYKSTT